MRWVGRGKRVMAMGKARASRLVAWVVLVPASVLTVVFRERFAELHILGQGLGAVLMLMVCWRILRRVFTTRDVTWGTISGALPGAHASTTRSSGTPALPKQGYAPAAPPRAPEAPVGSVNTTT